MPATQVRARTHVLPLVVVACLVAPTLVLGAAARGKPARATPLTDANIAAIVMAANQGDIKNGELALKSGSQAAVRDFGQMMVTDHTSANDKTKALAARLNLKPVQNATSRGLTRSANAKHAELARLHGVAFDKAYMDAEVTMHQEVLQMLDEKLIPAAKNAELKDLLTGVRPVIASHLDKAKEVRGNLKG